MVWVLAWVGRLESQLCAPKMTDSPVAAREDVDGGGVGPVVHNRTIVLAELPIHVGVERQILPAALYLEGDLSLNR